MSSTAEQTRSMTDLFQIGVYSIEVVILAAIVYAMIAFPMWLKPLSP